MHLQPYTGEPDIQRLFSAFKRKKVDRVPNFEVLIEDQHVEKLLGRHAGNTLSYGGDPAKGVSEGRGGAPHEAGGLHRAVQADRPGRHHRGVHLDPVQEAQPRRLGRGPDRRPLDQDPAGLEGKGGAPGRRGHRGQDGLRAGVPPGHRQVRHEDRLLRAHGRLLPDAVRVRDRAGGHDEAGLRGPGLRRGNAGGEHRLLGALLQGRGGQRGGLHLDRRRRGLQDRAVPARPSSCGRCGCPS